MPYLPISGYTFVCTDTCIENLKTGIDIENTVPPTICIQANSSCPF